jgi:hypothetical protein
MAGVDLQGLLPDALIGVILTLLLFGVQVYVIQQVILILLEESLDVQDRQVGTPPVVY